MAAGNQAKGVPAPGARAKRSEFDVGVAHPARVYDYWLGGKDNFAADREAAESVIAARPTVVRDVRANRAFMRRAVAYLAAEAGMRQFLDIGTGIPTRPNLHEVAQGITPAARVVYADNDPIVLSHARALLTSSPQGATAYIDADLRDPGAILKEAARTLDFARPVAIVLVGILFLISDDEDPYGIVAQLMDAVPSGSSLVITHPASDVNSEAVAEGARRYNQSVATRQTRRSFTQVTRFFEGLDVVEPGIVQCHRWRPGPGIDVRAYEVSAWAAVARKR
ncbi:MAG: SAM-dependent methyltransferase [Streptosporangiaceae bacterium]